MPKRIAKHTVAEWRGDDLIIHWYGMEAYPDEVGAIWRGDERPALVFHGMSQSKAWPMQNKPSADEALRLINEWQRG
jgi:hypothetical protein